MCSPQSGIDHKTGAYCLRSEPVTGTMIPTNECHSVDDWAKQGVTFSRR